MTPHRSLAARLRAGLGLWFPEVDRLVRPAVRCGGLRSGAFDASGLGSGALLGGAGGRGLLRVDRRRLIHLRRRGSLGRGLRRIDEAIEVGSPVRAQTGRSSYDFDALPDVGVSPAA